MIRSLTLAAAAILVLASVPAGAQPANTRPPAAGTGAGGRAGTPPATGNQGTGTGAATTGAATTGAAGAAGAAAADQPMWSTSCASEGRTAALDCTVEQRAVVTNTGQLMTLVRVRVPADTKKPVLMIQLPLGLFLPAGITLDIDGASPQKIELQTCDAQGCYAGWPIPNEMIAAMFNGQKLNVGFQNLAKQPIKVPMSLPGFRAAFAKIN